MREWISGCKTCKICKGPYYVRSLNPDLDIGICGRKSCMWFIVGEEE